MVVGFMGGSKRARQKPSVTNKTTIFGLMGGLAAKTGKPVSWNSQLQKKATNYLEIPLKPAAGLAYMKGDNPQGRYMLSKNPAGSGGVGRGQYTYVRCTGSCPIPDPNMQTLRYGHNLVVALAAGQTEYAALLKVIFEDFIDADLIYNYNGNAAALDPSHFGTASSRLGAFTLNASLLGHSLSILTNGGSITYAEPVYSNSGNTYTITTLSTVVPATDALTYVGFNEVTVIFNGDGIITEITNNTNSELMGYHVVEYLKDNTTLGDVSYSITKLVGTATYLHNTYTMTPAAAMGTWALFGSDVGDGFNSTCATSESVGVTAYLYNNKDEFNVTWSAAAGEACENSVLTTETWSQILSAGSELIVGYLSSANASSITELLAAPTCTDTPLAGGTMSIGKAYVVVDSGPKVNFYDGDTVGPWGSNQTNASGDPLPSSWGTCHFEFWTDNDPTIYEAVNNGANGWDQDMIMSFAHPGQNDSGSTCKDDSPSDPACTDGTSYSCFAIETAQVVASDPWQWTSTIMTGQYCDCWCNFNPAEPVVCSLIIPAANNPCVNDQGDVTFSFTYDPTKPAGYVSSV